MLVGKHIVVLPLLSVCFSLVLAELKSPNESKSKGDKDGKKEDNAMKKLLDAEKTLTEKILEYCDKEEKRLQKLKDIATQDREKLETQSVTNPINAFVIIKRHLDSELMRTLRHNSYEEVVDPILEVLPNTNDLKEAVKVVLELQDSKDLSTKDIANGDVPGFEGGKIFNIDDCFQIGKVAYNNADYYHAILWMEETMARIEAQKNITAANPIPVLDYLAFALYQKGNLQRAWWVTKEMLKLDPDNERANSNIGYYESEMKEKKLKVPTSEKDLPPIINQKPIVLDL